MTADCTKTGIGQLPIQDLGAGTYQGEQGGLYPGGSNDCPESYALEGYSAGLGVTPVNGKTVLLAISMSNGQEFFDAFKAQAAADARVNQAITIHNGSIRGIDATEWANAKNRCWKDLVTGITAAGLSASQVRAIWMLHGVQPNNWSGHPFPTFAHEVQGYLAKIIAKAESTFPNVKQIHLSALSYQGYCGLTAPPGYMEPLMGHDNQFAIKWAIADRIEGHTSGRSWVGWSANLWADGIMPRSDGLAWLCSDYEQDDGIHPSADGELKGGQLLLDVYLGDPTTPWFRV